MFLVEFIFHCQNDYPAALKGMGSFALGYLCHHNFHFREDKDDVLLFFAGKNNETPPQLKKAMKKLK